MIVRRATPADGDAVWAIFEPVVRAGETYPLPRDMSRRDALAYWFMPSHAVFVAETDEAGGEGDVVGAYYLQANQPGLGSHVANCGYLVRPDARGRGIGRALCAHSFAEAKRRGFRSMQYNLVVATNAPAVHLWQAMGMRIVGTLPGAFAHPTQGYVDAYVMYKTL